MPAQQFASSFKCFFDSTDYRGIHKGPPVGKREWTFAGNVYLGGIVNDVSLGDFKSEKLNQHAARRMAKNYFIAKAQAMGAVRAEINIEVLP